MTRHRRLAAALGVLILLAGCGIPVEEEPRALPTGPGSTPTVPEASAAPDPTESQATLWFVKESELVPVQRVTDGPVDSQDLIDQLVAGPTPAEREAGIRSAVVSVVTGEPLVITAEEAGVVTADLPDNEVAVVLEPAFTALLAEEQVLVLGEVVTTLAVGQIEQVLFVDDDGQTLGVPLADGRLRNGPVVPEDYASLIAGAGG